MEIKNRCDVEAQYKWDLSHIFADKQAWETAFAEAEKLAGEFPKYEGTLANGRDALKAALDAYSAMMEKTELVYVYSFLTVSGDNGDPEFQAMRDRAMGLYVRAMSAVSFISPELLAIPESDVTAWLADDSLKTYRFMVEDVCRARPYTLSAEQEKMLAMLADAADGPDNSFTMLESVDIKFPVIEDEDGNDVELTHGNYSVFRESRDRRVRKDAFEGYFGEFNKYINTFTALYANAVKFDKYFAEVRGFEGPIQRALFDSNVPVAVYENLIEQVHGALDAMEEYTSLMREQLGLDELHSYDMYTPLVAEAGQKMPFDEGRELVKKALRPLGAEYAKLLDRAFDEGWIDRYENRGKTTGAYSCGVHGVHPYVLLNYADKVDDAFTLAHELGHAMHSWFSSQNNDYINHDYKILVAEVASTVNEVLLLKYMLSVEKEPAKRAYLVNHFLEGFRTTLFRQTLFAEFEMNTHEMAMRGEPLTAESLNALYRRLNEQYYRGVVIDDLQAMEWARIPHFYRAFYVYQYATGYSSAVAIASRILETGDASGYLKFLSTGGSDYPLNELKIAGVDLTDPSTVASALNVFREQVGEFRRALTGDK